MRKCISLWLPVLIPLISAAQVDTVQSKKNVIKFVMTTNFFYENAIVFGYERAIRKNQSLNIIGGQVLFPTMFSGNNLVRVNQELDNDGFTVGVDYRFYLRKENKFAAPRGVYIAPFVSYYNLSKEWELYSTSSASPSTANLKGEVIFLNIGGQIGYQFIVKDRLTFDFIFFGPSITNYRFNLDLDGNFTTDEENEIIDEVLDNFPLLSDLIDNNEVSLRGNRSVWAPGFRFTCMIGYTFGRKTK